MAKANTQPDFQRARRPEHKEQRRTAILDAARRLGSERGVRNVSLGDIAAEVGIHKSALLRYFETREEIYLHLTAEGWGDWAADATRALEGMGAATPAQVSAVLARTLGGRPLFCELLTHAALHLERNVSLEAVRSFKLTALAALDELVAALCRALPLLDETSGRDLVATTSSLAGSLWQVSRPPETLARLYREDPRLGHAAVDFAPRLERLTHATLRGLLLPDS